ncbi:MAG TPA: hypothetical protein ENG87_03810 [Candidatus Pacearchaeota archaeon]|nr:N-acetyl-gamma-glutamyl-phosphate reductase [archaeon BMS3Abin17]HDK42479.1 hypothetical protein [Candidatus Pacearchaeota archaeon]HDZ60472.1 hypothetical protein [Candidatus Pacearchaeota archaeon]
MVNVGIIGHTGRLGKPLVEILNKHPNVKIVYTESRKEGIKGNLAEAELVFLALPYGESEKCVSELKGKKIIDLSIDHRCKNGWIYGLPELNNGNIKGAERVANPGCYATAVIEALLLLKDVITNIKIKAYSGVSGRPNQPIIEEKGIEKYAKGREHPQVAEIEKFLGKQIESFEPHLVYPIKTGVVVIISVQLKPGFSVDKLLGNHKFLKLADFKPDNVSVDYLKDIIKEVENSNFCKIAYNINENNITIISALDNLIKGGAGQAVQNFNIMYGFDEGTGLI